MNFLISSGKWPSLGEFIVSGLGVGLIGRRKKRVYSLKDYGRLSQTQLSDHGGVSEVLR